MAAAKAIVIPQPLAPEAPAALQGAMMEAAPAHPATLLVYGAGGRMVSLGRYLRWTGANGRGGVGVVRRLSGGRVWGAGAGWVGVALVASPDLAVCGHERIGALRPEQMMNRLARGLLDGLGALGLKCFYRGRDSITAGGREVALCSLEVDERQTVLFEAMVAAERGMDALTDDLETLDPGGELVAPMYDAATSTTLRRELGHEIGFAEIADALVTGYAGLCGGFERRELSHGEHARIEARATAPDAPREPNGTSRPVAAMLISRMRGQLGFVEAALALAADAGIERLELTGDFIANSSMPSRLEGELRGRRLELPAVAAAVAKVLRDGSNFLLGLGEPENLVRLLMSAR